MAERELNRRRLERHAEPCAEVAQPAGAVEDVGRRGRIVVRGARGEDAAVEDAAGDHGDAPIEAERQQLVGAARVEQRVPPREEEAVEVAGAGEPAERRGVVHADADRTHRAFGPQALERTVRAVDRLGVVVVRIVDENDVDAVEAQPVEALLEGTQRALVAEVEHRERRGTREGSLRRPGRQEPPHLRREHELVGRDLLGEPGSVERRGVEQLQACVESTADDGVCRLVRDGFEQAAERRGAEAEAGCFEAGPPERDPVPRVHGRLVLPGGRSPSASSGRSSEEPRCSRSHFSLLAMWSALAALASSGSPATTAS